MLIMIKSCLFVSVGFILVMLSSALVILVMEYLIKKLDIIADRIVMKKILALKNSTTKLNNKQNIMEDN